MCLSLTAAIIRQLSRMRAQSFGNSAARVIDRNATQTHGNSQDDLRHFRFYQSSNIFSLIHQAQSGVSDGTERHAAASDLAEQLFFAATRLSKFVSIIA
jgi:hypothetical protein